MNRVVPGSALMLLAFLSAEVGAGDPPAEGSKTEAGLGMTKPTLCVEVRGYEDYDTRPGDELTKDEKLVIYYRPLRYEEKAVGRGRQIHLTQDFRVRKRGKKPILQQKLGAIDYKTTYETPTFSAYMTCGISLKGLKPGDYDLDVILHDKIGGSDVTEVVPFRVRLGEASTGEKKDGDSGETGKGPTDDPARKKGRAGRP